MSFQLLTGRPVHEHRQERRDAGIFEPSSRVAGAALDQLLGQDRAELTDQVARDVGEPMRSVSAIVGDGTELSDVRMTST